MERFLPYACNKCEKDVSREATLACKDCGLVFCSYACFLASWEAGEQHSAVHGGLAALLRVHSVLSTSANESMAAGRIKRLMAELPDAFPKKRERSHIPENAAVRMLREIVDRYKSDATAAVLRELGIYVGPDFEIAFAKKFLETLLLDVFARDAPRARHLFLRLAGKGYARTLVELDRMLHRRSKRMFRLRKSVGRPWEPPAIPISPSIWMQIIDKALSKHSLRALEKLELFPGIKEIEPSPELKAGWIISAIESGDPEALEFLKTWGNITPEDARGTPGRRPLVVAAAVGNDKHIEILKDEYGLTKDDARADGNAAFRAAVAADNYMAVANLALKFGLTKEDVKADGWIALRTVLKYNFFATARVLLFNNHRPIFGLTKEDLLESGALAWAYASPEMTKILLDFGFTEDEIEAAVVAAKRK